MSKYIGEKVAVPFRENFLEIKDIKQLDKEKQLAYLEDGTIISLDILKTKDGKYLTEEK